MHTPRWLCRETAWLMAVCLVLGVGSTATASVSYEQIQSWKAEPIVQEVRVAQQFAPDVDDVPAVVAAIEEDRERPDTPGNNPPGGNTTPEPGSLASGAIGASLALAAWWRKRRKTQADQPGGFEDLEKVEVVM